MLSPPLCQGQAMTTIANFVFLLRPHTTDKHLHLRPLRLAGNIIFYHRNGKVP